MIRHDHLNLEWVARTVCSLPEYYWNSYSEEQRLKELAMRLHKLWHCANELTALVNAHSETLSSIGILAEELDGRMLSMEKYIGAFDTMVNDLIAAVYVRIELEKDNSIARDAAEQAAREQGDADLLALFQQDQARQDAELAQAKADLTQYIDTNITNVTNAFANAVTNLETDIDNLKNYVDSQDATERQERIAADTSLDQRLTSAETNIANLVTAVAQEASTRAQADTNLQSQITLINSRESSVASSTNRHVTQSEVDAAIASNAGAYLTADAAGMAQFATFAALQSGPWYYQGASRTPQNADTAIFSNAADGTWMCRYDGVQWSQMYQISSLSFTSAQMAAIDSGATAQLIDWVKELVMHTVVVDVSTVPTATGIKTTVTTLDAIDPTNETQASVTIEGGAGVVLTPSGTADALILTASADAAWVAQQLDANVGKANLTLATPSGVIGDFNANQSVNETLTIPAATNGSVGLVRGTVSDIPANSRPLAVINSQVVLPMATSALAGAVRPGANMELEAGTEGNPRLNVPAATLAAPGVVRPDGTTLGFDASGKLSLTGHKSGNAYGGISQGWRSEMRIDSAWTTNTPSNNPYFQPSASERRIQFTVPSYVIPGSTMQMNVQHTAFNGSYIPYSGSNTQDILLSLVGDLVRIVSCINVKVNGTWWKTTQNYWWFTQMCCFSGDTQIVGQATTVNPGDVVEVYTAYYPCRYSTGSPTTKPQSCWVTASASANGYYIAP